MAEESMIPTLVDIQQAAIQLKGQVVRTPTFQSRWLSRLIEGTVCLKMENMQRTGSFKPRGAYIKLVSLSKEQKERGVIAMSAGNHAQGVAYHAQRLGIPATIVMPETTPNAKIERTRQFGAKIILKGESLKESEIYALPIAEQEGLTVIHPYNDPEIIRGQGTVALEILEDFPEVDTLIIPVGGGGLAAGMCLAAKALRPSIEIYGVQSAFCTVMTRNTFPDMPLPTPIKASQTIAEGINVKAPGQLTQGILEDYLDGMLITPEEDIEVAIANLITQQKVVSEGAGAAGVAALMNHKEKFKGRNIAVVICGGNIDERLLANILLRHILRSHRLIKLAVDMDDLPGSLALVSDLIRQKNGNIVEIKEQRLFAPIGPKQVRYNIIVETHHEEHSQEILSKIKDEGLEVTLLGTL